MNLLSILKDHRDPVETMNLRCPNPTISFQVPAVQEGLLRLQHVDQAPPHPLRGEALPVQAVPPQVLSVGKPQQAHEDTRAKREMNSMSSRLSVCYLFLVWQLSKENKR